MKSFITALLVTLSYAVSIAAQATPTSKITWDQPGPDLATVQAYTYTHYDDAAATGTALSPVACVANGTIFTCSAPFPAFTPGTHTMQLTATNIAGESPKSDVFSFTFVVVPGKPANLRITR